MRPNESLCPSHIQEALLDYANNRHEHGHFVTAVLENNLEGAVVYADERNLPVLPHIVAFTWEHVPREAWGSPQKVSAWLRGRIADPQVSRG